MKTLLKKKADYFSKLNKDIKTLGTCKKELETLEKFYEERKKKKNFVNPKIEEDINRLKEDLTGNESEIYNKVQNDQAFIIRKQIHQEKVPAYRPMLYHSNGMLIIRKSSYKRMPTVGK